MVRFKFKARLAVTAGLCAAMTLGGITPAIAVAAGEDIPAVVETEEEGGQNDTGAGQVPGTSEEGAGGGSVSEGEQNDSRNVVEAGSAEELVQEVASATGELTVMLTQDITIEKSTASKNGAAIELANANAAAKVTVDGGSHTITVADDAVFDSAASVLGVHGFAGSITIKNLTVVSKQDVTNSKHALNVWDSPDVVLEGITLTGAKEAGLVVNGSKVVATNLSTSGNVWGAVNVDKQGTFVLGAGANLAEDVQVWTEDSDSTITASDFTKVIGGTAGDNVLKGYTYFTTDASRLGEVQVTSGDADTPHVYKTFAEAVEKAPVDSTITLLADVTISTEGVGAKQGIINFNQNVTVDGASHVITVSGADKSDVHALNAQNNAEVALCNLTIDGKGVAKHGVNVYGATVSIDNLTIKDCTGYAVVVNGGAATVKDLRSSGNGWGGINIDGKNAEGALTIENATIQEDNSVYLEQGGETKQGIKVSIAGGAYQKVNVGQNVDADSLTITGGTFANDVAAYVPTGHRIQEADGSYTVSKVDLASVVSEAMQYRYEDDYAYAGAQAITEGEGGPTLTTTYEQKGFELTQVMNDLARYLGALHRVDNGQSVKSITYGETAYTWNAEGTLKGSNWAADGKTLVSAIVDDFKTGELSSIKVTLSDGSDQELALTLAYRVVDSSTPTPQPPAGDNSETVTNPDGSTTTTVTDKDGSQTVTTEATDGTTTVVEKDKDGSITSIKAEVSKDAAETGAVTLPMEAVGTDTGVGIAVTLPEGTDPVKVTVPVAAEGDSGRPAPGAVLVLVAADGTETVLPKTGIVDGGLVAELTEGGTIKVEDRSVGLSDIQETDWFAAEVAPFATARDIIRGVPQEDGSFHFSGGGGTSRAEFVTMLYRLESEPDASGATFDDVAGADWYAEAAAWGQASGVVEGYGDGDVFGGGDAVTREQLAMFLMRYASKLGLDTSARADIDFPDAGEVADWSRNAVSWAVAEGILRGTGDTGELNPGDGATRAEVAATIMRFMEGVMYM